MAGPFAVQQAICFVAVPVVTLLVWLFVPFAPLGLSGWRWFVLFDSIGAIAVWWVRFSLPESPRWLAQQGRIAEAEAVMGATEAKVTASRVPHCRPPGRPSLKSRATAT